MPVDSTGFPLWEVWSTTGGKVGRRCFSSEGRRKDCFGKGELPDSAQVLALEDIERGEAGSEAVAFGGGGWKKMESPTRFGAYLRWCGNHGVVVGRMDGKSFLSLCVPCGGLEDGRGSRPPNPYGCVGHPFPHVGCCCRSCSCRALG